MDLRVEYYQDVDTRQWGFVVPRLRIVGGGVATRAEAEEQAALFRAQRAYIASLVCHLPDAWDRHVQFTRAGLPDAQRLTVGFVVRIQARHALEHIADIREIRRVHGR